MGDKVLVTYATRYGGTAEIAEKIGGVLGEAGLQADVVPVAKVGDLTPYRAVVLGSAVYIGNWRREAARFLQVNERSLVERSVWLFSSGPTGEGDAVELMDGWRLPKGLQAVVDRIQPQGITIFHGVVNIERLNPIERWMLKNVQSPIGDFRDWDAIASWAETIAGALKD